ncbi:hypothetical protein P171DRAFT_446804 [Karstenula rhodostoma CBS 690.94]|uniref:Uncharacterized protein n=1 Tax=Karstenula rhodostoma CBS 690.94 TaxID=1392251 RepID=A0A9P4PD95_9PLEO|nr:hypothetical protein P171DRAFT_446804 [Karstenula rhodostoma CBS 690.94]
MSRYSEILNSLQGLRHDAEPSVDPNSDAAMLSPADPRTDDDAVQAHDVDNAVQTHDVDDAVQTHDADPATNLPPSSTIADDSASNTDTDTDEKDVTDKPKPTFHTSGFTPAPGTHYTYTIPSPRPTLTLPATHPFRTTPTGYPIFPSRARPSRPPTPRVAAFIAHWTKTYTEMGRDPVAARDGMFELRLACEVRGLVTYGGLERLVERLVERAVRDAGRGWSEVRTGVGRVSIGEAPEGPVGDEEEEAAWWVGVSYGG